MNDYLSRINWLVADWHPASEIWKAISTVSFQSRTHAPSIHNRNRHVHPNDVVLCVGNVTSIDAPDYLSLVGKLNGIKLLVRRNHDEPHSISDFGEYFVRIVPNAEGVEFEIERVSGFPLMCLTAELIARPISIAKGFSGLV